MSGREAVPRRKLIDFINLFQDNDVFDRHVTALEIMQEKLKSSTGASPAVLTPAKEHESEIANLLELLDIAVSFCAEISDSDDVFVLPAGLLDENWLTEELQNGV